MTDITFVCCIEAGGLEIMTIRMIESLRKRGGRYSNARIIAVTPRFGPKLTRDTLKQLSQMNVTYIRKYVNKEAWFNYMNKPYALSLAADVTDSEYLCWLDSDILILDEPFKSIRNSQLDIFATASDKNIGTIGPTDRFEPYWQSLCEFLGIKLESMPWITTIVDSKRIRLYFNSGVFVFRRTSGFHEKYLRTCKDILSSKISNTESGIYFTDQVALGLTICKYSFTYEELPISDNFPINGNLLARGTSLSGPISVLHYHDLMWPKYWSSFCRILSKYREDMAIWCNNSVPLKNNLSIKNKILAKILKFKRNLVLKKHLVSCKDAC